MKKTKQILSLFLSVCMILTCMAGISVTASATGYGAYIVWRDKVSSIKQGDTIEGQLDDHIGFVFGDVVTIKPAGGGADIKTRVSKWTADADYNITAWEKTDYYSGNLGPYESEYGGYDNVDIHEYTFTVQSAAPSTVAVTGVTLAPTTATLTAGGDAVALTATVAPENATDKKVKWSVVGAAVELYSDAECTTEIGADATDVLTVYAKGISGGYEADVNVTSNADSTKSATCAVTVNAASAAKPAYGISMPNGGIAYVNEEEVTEAPEGTTVTIVAPEAESGKEFNGWTTTTEGVAFADAGAETTTFTMPGTSVTVTANFADKSDTPTPAPETPAVIYYPAPAGTAAAAETAPAETAAADISALSITGVQDKQNQNALSWDSVPDASGYSLSVMVNGEYVFMQDLGTATSADIVLGTNGKYYVSTGGDYTIYKYSEKKGTFVKTGTLAADKIDSIRKANNISNEFMVKIKDKNGKETDESNSYKVSVKVYYKPALKVSSKDGSITIRWNKVEGAEKYRVYKYVDGTLKQIAETEKTGVKINGKKSGSKYTYAVKAFVDGKWTKVYASDLASITVK